MLTATRLMFGYKRKVVWRKKIFRSMKMTIKSTYIPHSTYLVMIRSDWVKLSFRKFASSLQVEDYKESHPPALRHPPSQGRIAAAAAVTGLVAFLTAVVPRWRRSRRRPLSTQWVVATTSGGFPSASPTNDTRISPIKNSYLIFVFTPIISLLSLVFCNLCLFIELKFHTSAIYLPSVVADWWEIGSFA